MGLNVRQQKYLNILYRTGSEVRAKLDGSVTDLELLDWLKEPEFKQSLADFRQSQNDLIRRSISTLGLQHLQQRIQFGERHVSCRKEVRQDAEGNELTKTEMKEDIRPVDSRLLEFAIKLGEDNTTPSRERTLAAIQTLSDAGLLPESAKDNVLSLVAATEEAIISQVQSAASGVNPKAYQSENLAENEYTLAQLQADLFGV